MNATGKIRKLMSLGSTQARPHHRVLLRGGRLRKTGRGVITYAPWLGMAAAAGMGMGLAAGSGAPATAQDLGIVCTEVQATSGTYVCSGDSGDPMDMRTVFGETDAALVIRAMSDFMLKDGDMLTLTGGTSQRFTLNAGASIMGTVTADMNVGERILEFNAGDSRTGTFTLPDPFPFRNFTEFEKTGRGTWELTGTMPTGTYFKDAGVTEGTLRLLNASLRVERCLNGTGGNSDDCDEMSEIGKADGFTIGVDGTLAVDGRSEILRPNEPAGVSMQHEGRFAPLINNGGNIAFVMNDTNSPAGSDSGHDPNCPGGSVYRDTCLDALVVGRYVTGGGTLTFNVRLNDGAKDRADMLNVVSSSYRDALLRGPNGPDTINIRVHGDPAHFSGGDTNTGDRNQIRLVNVPSSRVGSGNEFEAGVAFVGRGSTTSS